MVPRKSQFNINLLSVITASSLTHRRMFVLEYSFASFSYLYTGYVDVRSMKPIIISELLAMARDYGLKQLEHLCIGDDTSLFSFQQQQQRQPQQPSARTIARPTSGVVSLPNGPRRIHTEDNRMTTLRRDPLGYTSGYGRGIESFDDPTADIDLRSSGGLLDAKASFGPQKSAMGTSDPSGVQRALREGGAGAGGASGSAKLKSHSTGTSSSHHKAEMIERGSGDDGSSSPGSFDWMNAAITNDSSFPLAADLTTCINSRKFSDFVFYVGGRIVHAHKLLLYTRTGYFRNLFTRNSDLRSLKLTIGFLPAERESNPNSRSPEDRKRSGKESGSASGSGSMSSSSASSSGSHDLVPSPCVPSYDIFLAFLKWIYTDFVDTQDENKLAHLQTLANRFHATSLVDLLQHITVRVRRHNANAPPSSSSSSSSSTVGQRASTLSLKTPQRLHPAASSTTASQMRNPYDSQQSEVMTSATNNSSSTFSSSSSPWPPNITMTPAAALSSSGGGFSADSGIFGSSGSSLISTGATMAWNFDDTGGDTGGVGIGGNNFSWEKSEGDYGDGDGGSGTGRSKKSNHRRRSVTQEQKQARASTEADLHAFNFGGLGNEDGVSDWRKNAQLFPQAGQHQLSSSSTRGYDSEDRRGLTGSANRVIRWDSDDSDGGFPLGGQQQPMQPSVGDKYNYRDQFNDPTSNLVMGSATTLRATHPTPVSANSPFPATRPAFLSVDRAGMVDRPPVTAIGDPFSFGMQRPLRSGYDDDNEEHSRTSSLTASKSRIENEAIANDPSPRRKSSPRGVSEKSSGSSGIGLGKVSASRSELDDEGSKMLEVNDVKPAKVGAARDHDEEERKEKKEKQKEKEKEKEKEKKEKKSSSNSLNKKKKKETEAGSDAEANEGESKVRKSKSKKSKGSKKDKKEKKGKKERSSRGSVIEVGEDGSGGGKSSSRRNSETDQSLLSSAGSSLEDRKLRTKKKKERKGKEREKEKEGKEGKSRKSKAKKESRS
jgi:hypothetical protein